jgi:hypothetical protein
MGEDCGNLVTACNETSHNIRLQPSYVISFICKQVLCLDLHQLVFYKYYFLILLLGQKHLKKKKSEIVGISQNCYGISSTQFCQEFSVFVALFFFQLSYMRISWTIICALKPITDDNLAIWILIQIRKQISYQGT